MWSPFRDPSFDRFWAAAQDLDMPLSLHTATDRADPRVGDAAFRLDVKHVPPSVFVNKDFQIRQTLADMILSGVFERFPRLRVGSVEHELAWIPFFLDQMDYTYTQRPPRGDWYRFRESGVLPSDFFRRHVFSSFQEDAIGIRVRDVIGVDTLMWGSDYPHTESTFPRSQEILGHILEGVEPDDVLKIVATNAADLYHFDRPARARARTARRVTELVIRGGTVVDGTGAPGRRADVGIAGGRIVAIGDGITGDRELDAGGALVVPGFVDIHTHYDPQVLWDPALTPSSFQGVTAVVAGNCGYSVAPTAPADRASLFRTLDKVEDMRIATLEAGVAWDFESYPEYLDAVSPARHRDQLRRLRRPHRRPPLRHGRRRLRARGHRRRDRPHAGARRRVDPGGALGFSSDRAGFHVGDGGRPVPSIVATQAETEALMRVTAEIGRGIVHVAPGENFSWLYDFQPSLGRTITWSALLTYPPDTASRARPTGRSSRATRRGAARAPTSGCRSRAARSSSRS